MFKRLYSTDRVGKQYCCIYEYTLINSKYRGAGKSLARPGRKQATATENFVFHTSYL